jgi:CrcB protein
VLRGRRAVVVVIALGGMIGSLGRWGMAQALRPAPGAFPWATFWVNVTGAFLIGALMYFVLEVWPPHRLVRPFLAIGILGGWTTFSTYMLDARVLVVDGHLLVATAYVVGTLVLGLAAVWLGFALARAAAARPRTAGGNP